uniref:Uncharacterized protein n=1 Tax=Romanomermis culicivorax TaxID=13658 RepID=A0A915KSL5_ROMCU
PTIHVILGYFGRVTNLKIVGTKKNVKTDARTFDLPCRIQYCANRRIQEELSATEFGFLAGQGQKNHARSIEQDLHDVRHAQINGQQD